MLVVCWERVSVTWLHVESSDGRVRQGFSSYSWKGVGPEEVVGESEKREEE